MLLASAGRKVLFHSSPSYELYCIYGDYEQPVRCLKFSKDSKYLLIVPENKNAEIIRLGTANKTKCLQILKIKNVSAATFYNRTHRYIALGCKTGQVSVWDTKTRILYKKLPNVDSCVRCLDISATDNHIIVGCDNGSIVLYGLMTNSKIEDISLPHDRSVPTSVNFSPRNRGLVAVTDEAGYLSIWDIVKRKPTVMTYNHHTSVCSDMTFSPINSNFIASVGYDFTIHMYDMRSSDPIYSKETAYQLTSVAMSPDGLRLACGHHQGGVLVYDLRNQSEPILELCSETGNPTCICYNHIYNTSGLQNYNRGQIGDNNYNNNSLLELLQVSSTSRIQYDSQKNMSLVSVSIKSNHNMIEESSDSFFSDIERSDTTQSAACSLVCSPKPSSSASSAMHNESAHEMKGSDLDEYVKFLQTSFDNSIKRCSQEMMHMFKTKFLEMQMVLCKQHLELGEKISKLKTQPYGISHSSRTESPNDVVRISAENARLRHEINALKTERQRFISSTILNTHNKKNNDNIKISKNASLP